jgi:plastocyanin
MKVKKSVWMIVSIGVCINLIFFTGLVCSQQETEQKHQVISMLPDSIKPLTATVAPGTTVIWINEGRGMVEIMFTNSKSMITACGSPLGFAEGLPGQFISNMIPFASVASLCFLEKGEFNYTALRAPTGTTPPNDQTREYKGKIIVK